MPFIKFDNVSLEFPGVVHKRGMRLTSERPATAPGGQMRMDDKDRLNIRALDGISIDIQSGDRVALIGHNGAGKSTLLRTMAGLYKPTIGKIDVEGKIAPLFNLNFGIDAEASGYENILIRGLFLGMTKAEIEGKISVIAEFCELGDFLYLPVRTYSSGMSARLGFAISTHIDAEILLLDEAIGTGDAAFFKKACKQIESFISNANIMVLASHSNKILGQFCEKGILLEHGKIVLAGPLDDVLHGYRDLQKKAVSIDLGSAGQVDSEISNAVKNVSIKKPSVNRSILVLNDDFDYSPNPGCKLVRNGFKSLFTGLIAKESSWDYIPGHYWAKSFRSLASEKDDRLEVTPNKFVTGSKHAVKVDLNEWENVRLKLTESDSYIIQKIKSADIVLVNGGNCMHHNTPRSLALLALMKTAISDGAKVVLANATVQMMDDRLLEEVLSKLALIHVRDKASQEYLQKNNLGSIYTSDVAFLGLAEQRESCLQYLNAEEYVLVTGGITVSEGSLKSLLNGVREFGKKAVYLCVGDAGENNIVTTVCKEHNVPIVFVKKIENEELVSFLAQFHLAISGRHYINILLMRAGVPFVSLPSDTWIIEETCNQLSASMPVISSYNQILDSLNYIEQNRIELVQQCKDASVDAEKSIHSFKKGLGSFVGAG